jgi:hypothetical protein
LAERQRITVEENHQLVDERRIESKR